MQAQRGNYWYYSTYLYTMRSGLLFGDTLPPRSPKPVFYIISMANFSLTVTTWKAFVLLSLTEMWKCCFLDLMCGECTISVWGKKTDVQWQKEKNASANAFVFCFFSSFFFGSYFRNAKPQITWTVYCTPRLKYGLPLQCSVHTFSFIAHSACRVVEVPERLPPVPACTQQHQYIREKGEMLSWI